MKIFKKPWAIAVISVLAVALVVLAVVLMNGNKSSQEPAPTDNTNPTVTDPEKPKSEYGVSDTYSYTITDKDGTAVVVDITFWEQKYFVERDKDSAVHPYDGSEILFNKTIHHDRTAVFPYTVKVTRKSGDSAAQAYLRVREFDFMGCYTTTLSGDVNKTEGWQIVPYDTTLVGYITISSIPILDGTGKISIAAPQLYSTDTAIDKGDYDEVSLINFSVDFGGEAKDAQKWLFAPIQKGESPVKLLPVPQSVINSTKYKEFVEWLEKQTNYYGYWPTGE
jgi:hypothetical protein